MNIVYAVKIMLALMIVALAMRIVAGRGLKQVVSPHDMKTGWIGIAGTLFVSCFAVKVPFFFVLLPIWALMLSNLFGRHGAGRLPAYALLVCICPPMGMELQNIGPIKDILSLNAPRILEIFLLAPEAVRLFNRRGQRRKPSWLVACDVATGLFYAYWMLYLYGGQALTVIVREGLGLGLDTLVPYYVLTRACVAADARRRAMGMILFGATYQSFVGMAESASGHYLYSQLQYLYNTRWAQSTGLMRGMWLRAEAAFPGPLALAVLLMFGLGLWFVMKPRIKTHSYTILGLSLTGGLLATYGRGPLLATMLLALGVAALRFLSGKKYLVLMLAGGAVLASAWSAGLGDAVIGLVSATTGADQAADFNVLYRQQLLTESLALLQQSPWWGVPNYLAYLENLRQGEGIIDLVNTYLVVALNVGAFGLSLFLIPFGVTLWKEASRAEDPDPASRREGRMWLPLTVAVMAAVFTVSPTSIVRPILVWVVALALARLQETLPEAKRFGFDAAAAAQPR
ncbi:MAG: O-antigen ligase family protein [Burkholderiaceae bacterium]